MAEFNNSKRYHSLIINVNMKIKGDKEDSNETKVDNGMNENGSSIGLHVSELHNLVLRRYLKQQSGT